MKKRYLILAAAVLLLFACAPAKTTVAQPTEPVSFVATMTLTPFQWVTNTPFVVSPSPAPVPVAETPTSALMMELAPEEVKLDEALISVEMGESMADCLEEGWTGGKFSYDLKFNDVVLNLRLSGLSYVRKPDNVGIFGVTAENNIFFVNGSNSHITVCIDSEGVYLKGLVLPE